MWAVFHLLHFNLHQGDPLFFFLVHVNGPPAASAEVSAGIGMKSPGWFSLNIFLMSFRMMFLR